MAMHAVLSRVADPAQPARSGSKEATDSVRGRFPGRVTIPDSNMGLGGIVGEEGVANFARGKLSCGMGLPRTG